MSEALDIEQVEARVALDPAAEGFGALAEAYRRAGRLNEARQVATAGLARRPDDPTARLVLGLLLWDAGDAAAARSELERLTEGLAGVAIGAAEPGAAAKSVPLADHELDEALAAVRPMLEEPSVPAPAPRERRPAGSEAFGVDEGPTFATETMARLYDAQGDVRAAEAIRRRLTGEAPGADDDGAAAGDDSADDPAQVVDTLETWLRNLQGSRP